MSIAVTIGIDNTILIYSTIPIYHEVLTIMFAARVERVINKPIQEVFRYLSDHAGYTQFKGVKVAELLSEGTQERNGKGAVRKIGAGPLEFIEEITEFERPFRMHYHITASKPFHIHHTKGEITLTQYGMGTKVEWETAGYHTMPILGPVFDKILQSRIGGAFGGILKGIEQA